MKRLNLAVSVVGRVKRVRTTHNYRQRKIPTDKFIQYCVSSFSFLSDKPQADAAETGDKQDKRRLRLKQNLREL